MDTIDRPDSNVPARYSAESPRVPAPMAAASYDLAVAAPAGGGMTVSPQLLVRGLIRHWWRIALGWLVLSAPLAYAIYQMVEPTYDASSWLEVKSNNESVYRPELHGAPDPELNPFLRTQVQLIRSDRTLDAAVANSTISNLPMLKATKDPKAALRGVLRVGIVGGDTNLIEVGLTSKDPYEAAAIVNAVVESFVEQHTSYYQRSNRSLKKELESERDKLRTEVEDMKIKLTDLIKRGNVPVFERVKISPDSREDEKPSSTSFAQVSQGDYQKVLDKLIENDLELINAEAGLMTARAQLNAAQQLAGEEGAERSRLQAMQLEERVQEEFTRDPEARGLIDEINRAKEAKDHAASMARQAASDPAVGHAVRRLKRLNEQWVDLWNLKHDEIQKRVLAGGDDQRPQAWETRIKQGEAMIEQLRARRQKLKEMLALIKVDDTNRNSDTLEAALLGQDLQQRRGLLEVIESKLKQLTWEISKDSARISVRDKASVPQTPSNNKRMKYMAAAPAGVLFLMLGLFLLLEIKAERVGDPESLSTRMQSEVYALPPLPTARSIRKRSDPDSDDQIEQFIQRLDHLRFAVCGNPTELEKGRCVLITSAIGGEGKTTLAAQLAARCGNAGMSTLLIDADLRRTGLCSLLDIPEGPGLSDALLNDEPAPTELVVPVQGGTFHLLPAGTPIPDTSRILQNRKLGLLIAQFRQLYDLVIIDSPPVLPVPDALVLGRWVDGAVLAVRYDISRFPQVERARRQLDGAGISVLGTVINGMKNSDSYYGRYSYSRKRSPQAESPATY